MKLSNKIRITETYKGESKFPFWKAIKVDDIIEVSTYVKGVGRGGNGLYATSIYFNNLTQNSEFRSTMNMSKNYLYQLKYVDA